MHAKGKKKKYECHNLGGLEQEHISSVKTWIGLSWPIEIKEAWIVKLVI